MSSLLNTKVFTMYYINEHDNLSKKEKRILFDFVKEADEKQLLHLLHTGEMVTENIIVTETKIDSLIAEVTDALGYKMSREVSEWTPFDAGVEGGYKLGQSAGLVVGRQQGVVAGMAAAAVVAAIATVGYKVYKAKLAAAARACAGKKGVAKQECMTKFKKDAILEKIKAMTKGIALCSKSKNPNQCKAKLQTKIEKEKRNLGVITKK